MSSVIRQQIDPRTGKRQPHNRIGGYYPLPDEDRFQPAMQSPQQQPQAPEPQTSVPDLGSLLSTVQNAGGGFQGPNFQLPGISGLSAGGGSSVGPDGVTISAPDQSGMYNSYMNTVSALGTGQQDLVGSIIANMLGLTGQLGTANINAGAQRDVAGINAESNEAIAVTQANSASEVAGIQTASAERIEQLRQAGLISELEAQERIANLNNASQQRIAEIQAQASVRPAELQYQQFAEGLESIQPFMQALLGQMSGGGIAGSSDSYQVDPQALVNNAQAQNAQAVASQYRSGGPSGGTASNDAAARAQAQDLASRNAQAAYQIPLQVNQQNFQNRQSAEQNDLQRLSTLANFIPNLFGSIS